MVRWLAFEAHEPAVPLPGFFLLASRPHDFDTGDVPVLAELLNQHFLGHGRGQVAHIQIGGGGVTVVVGACGGGGGGDG